MWTISMNTPPRVFYFTMRILSFMATLQLSIAKDTCPPQKRYFYEAFIFRNPIRNLFCTQISLKITICNLNSLKTRFGNSLFYHFLELPSSMNEMNNPGFIILYNYGDNFTVSHEIRLISNGPACRANFTKFQSLYARSEYRETSNDSDEHQNTSGRHILEGLPAVHSSFHHCLATIGSSKWPIAVRGRDWFEVSQLCSHLKRPSAPERGGRLQTVQSISGDSYLDTDYQIFFNRTIKFNNNFSNQ